MLLQLIQGVESHKSATWLHTNELTNVLRVWVLQNWLLGSRLGQKLTHPTSHLACSRDILGKNLIWTNFGKFDLDQSSNFGVSDLVKNLILMLSKIIFCSLWRQERTKMAIQGKIGILTTSKLDYRLTYFGASAVHSSKYLNEPKTLTSLAWTVLCKEIFQMWWLQWLECKSTHKNLKQCAVVFPWKKISKQK